MTEIRLTKTVKKGGCAAKVAAYELREILKLVRFPKPQTSVLVNGSEFDDAAVYQISENQYIIETLDFFTPIVDDPYVFGQVAAANAMSDVYAMGGDPKTALGILAFPLQELSKEIISKILQGAVDKLSEANADLVGGHSIDDDTLKFGLSVMGTATSQNLWVNKKAKPGDRLILTKCIGTGTLMASLKNDVFVASDLQPVFESMSQLNRIKDLLSDDLQSAIHTATDVTGFGVAGHAYNVARASDVSIRISSKALPLFENAREALKRQCLTKAHRTNREYVGAELQIAPEIESELQLLLFDPQTSGGLLLSVDESVCDRLLNALRVRFPNANVVGTVTQASTHRLFYDL